MKKNKKFLLTTLGFTIVANSLCGKGGHKEDPHYEWFEADKVAICEDGIYADTVRGLMRLNVVEYDRVQDRYLVKCSCLENPYLDPLEALSSWAETKGE